MKIFQLKLDYPKVVVDYQGNSVPSHSGIYGIRNKINGKMWVGQAQNFHVRWRSHLVRSQKGNNSSRLQASWDKHGWAAFEFLILEECSLEQLCDREHYFMEKFKSWDREFGYNLERYDRRGTRIVSDETRSRLSQTIKNSSKHKATTEARRGTHRTDDERRRISESLKGRPKPEGFSKGEKNPQFGKCGSLNSQYGKKWYMNPETGESRKFLPDEPIPEGWVPGRRVPRKNLTTTH